MERRETERRTGKGWRWPVAAALVLTAVFSVGTALLGMQVNRWQGEVERLREERRQLRTEALAAQETQAALQAQVEQLTEDEAQLRAQLEAAEREAEEARQALRDGQSGPEQEPKPNGDDPYPELYAQPADRESQAPEKTVYLTFDDGPSARTGEILDILKENGVRATFFVTGQTGEQAEALMRRVVEEGHTIGVHTYSHKYREVYASVSDYLADFDRIYQLVHEVTGVYPQILRFPGGTINSFNKKTYRAIVAEMDRRGFVHYDWNAGNGDAEGIDYSVAELVRNALSRVGSKRVIMLMHDSEPKTGTVQSLQAIIDGYRDAGYTFAPLTPEVKAITFD